MTPDEELMDRKGTNDPEWDSAKCRCERRGEYCEYCTWFYSTAEEREEA